MLLLLRILLLKLCNHMLIPIFLHSGDNTNLLLVSEPFNGENNKKWKKGIRLTLMSKNKLGFISGSLKQPSSTHADYQRWILVDYAVRCWLLCAIVHTIFETLMYATSSKYLWDELHERYGEPDNLMFFELQSKLHSLKQGCLSLAEYYGMFKSIWEDMADTDAFPECTCGVITNCSCTILKQIVDSSNRHKLVQFLMGLDHSYDTVRTSILSIDPLHSLNSVYSQLLRVEKQKHLSTLTTVQFESTALAAAHPPISLRNSPVLKRNKSDLVCTFCGKRGHESVECFKRLKKIPEWPVQDIPTAHVHIPAEEHVVHFAEHMCPFLSYLNNIRTLLRPSKVSLPDGRHKLVTTIGDICFTPTIVLKDVFHIPDFQHSLLSISKLTSAHNIRVFFDKRGCYFHDLATLEVLITGHRDHDLFRVYTTSPVVSSFSAHSVLNCNKIDVSSIHLLHSCLGQTAISKLRYLFPFSQSVLNSFHCKTCALSKHHRLPFNRSNSRASKIFDLIHVDLWGPYRIVNSTRSIARVPQQNGWVERKRRHIIETARALKLHAHLPTQFLGECVLSATHLINLMPTELLAWKMPSEVLFQKSPTYDHLRVIGYLCFALGLHPHKDKFSPKYHKCILIGNPALQKGYKLYDIQAKKVLFSRDVLFQESMFHYQSINIPFPVFSTYPMSTSQSPFSSPDTDILLARATSTQFF
ncbi:hypothetical protein RND81_10G072000 [Saponaria officinalis]|uniref:Uncharacterized protein n=1 Tax=Saponaria officinalis TaxID=3572 RepID=A0AAW1I1N1_SAPOF